MSKTLQFAGSFELDNFKIIELPSELHDHVDKCTSLYIKGLSNDEAVLCTSSATFTVREVQLSNSLLIIDPSDKKDEYKILGNLSSIIELSPCFPRLTRLDEILKDTLYDGPNNDQGFLTTRYTWDDLRSVVQASDAELIVGLNDRNAILIEGYYRVLSPKYICTVLDSILTAATTDDISFEAIALEDSLKSLAGHGIPDNVIDYCLRTFSDDIADTGAYRMSERKICKFIGVELLKTEIGKRWIESEFMGLWQQRVPEIFTVSLDMLKGQYITENSSTSSPTYLTYFPVQSLPLEPAARFQELFQAQKKWRAEEMKLYIEDLAKDKKKLDAFLLKYTRITKSESTGETFYTSRT